MFLKVFKVNSLCARALWLSALYCHLCATCFISPALAAPPAEYRTEPAIFPREAINKKKLGLNAFVNDQRFGSIKSQFTEVKRTLGIRHVRVLFAWNDAIQSAPNSAQNFSFYDDIIRDAPRRMKILVILTGLPSWMSDSENWIDGNPRKTFVQKWVRSVISRYRRKRKIIAWQIWNEPNTDGNPDNITMQMAEDPANYVDLLALAGSTMDELTPRKLKVSGATTSINQDFPETLDYNSAMKKAGVESLVDIWGTHYYSKRYEILLLPGGAADFLNSLTVPIWITESGEKGVDEQLAYAEEIWPLLLRVIPGIKRIYHYQFTEDESASEAYGLRTLNAGQPYSDLYYWLRDN